MKIKSLFIVTIILILGLFTVGCSGSKSIPVIIPLEESVKEIIISKGENYDFLDDELYNEKMEDLISTVLRKFKSYKIVYKLGNLDEDNIPEIAVFIERNPNNTEDQGLLQIYKFNGEGYELIDELAMNYDNYNYLMEIGKISENQNGLLVSNQVGAHSSITYGFILENGKLKNILNDKKLNLLSIYTNNEIALDKNGILNFSVYTIDPETIEQSAVDSDKITLWFKWDGINGAILTKVDREIRSLDTDHIIFRNLKSQIHPSTKNSFNQLIQHKSQLSYIDNTLLLIDYIEGLKSSLDKKNIKIQNLFNNYQSGYLLNEYGLSIDRLNELEYLKRDKTFENEKVLKNFLIDNLNLGLRLKNSEGKYYYVIDYSTLNEALGDDISKEYRDYINILSFDINKPFLIGENLMIDYEKLGDRINILEKFILTYPYSQYITEIENIYKSYSKVFLYGDESNPHFDGETNIIRDEVKRKWQAYIEKYPNSYIADVLSKLTMDINNNNNILTSEIKSNYNLLY